MKVLLKFHSTLTGGVDDKIKNLKPFKQIMINITICRSKPRLRIFLGKKKCATFAGNASQTKLRNIQIPFSIMKKIPNKYP